MRARALGAGIGRVAGLDLADARIPVGRGTGEGGLEGVDARQRAEVGEGRERNEEVGTLAATGEVLGHRGMPRSVGGVEGYRECVIDAGLWTDWLLVKSSMTMPASALPRARARMETAATCLIMAVYSLVWVKFAL